MERERGFEPPTLALSRQGPWIVEVLDASISLVPSLLLYKHQVLHSLSSSDVSAHFSLVSLPLNTYRTPDFFPLRVGGTLWDLLRMGQVQGT